MRHYNVSAAIVRNHPGHILMVRQPFHYANGEEFWVLPGGKVEAGESFLDAALRELREEAGAEVSGGTQVYTCNYQNPVDRTSVCIRMFAFDFAGGPLVPADPDDVVREAAFFPVPQAREKLALLRRWPMLHEPVEAWLDGRLCAEEAWEYVFDGAIWQRQGAPDILDTGVLKV